MNLDGKLLASVVCTLNFCLDQLGRNIKSSSLNYIDVSHFFVYLLVNCCSEGPNVSTTPIMAMGCWQCLHLSVVQLKGKHCRKPHHHNGVVDTFGQSVE